MDRFFTKTFFRFFFAFLLIIAIAFGILLVTAANSPEVAPTDNVAHGQPQ